MRRALAVAVPWLALSLLPACGATQRDLEFARLEVRLEMVEAQAARRRAGEMAMREKIGRLSERLRVMTRELAAARGEIPAVQTALPPARDPRAGMSPDPDELLPFTKSPSPAQLTHLWRRTGVLLDRLHRLQREGRSPVLQPLVDDYLAINIHGGLVNEGLRRKYFEALQRIHASASQLAARAPSTPGR